MLKWRRRSRNHNSTFRQTASGLAEKAIKVRETDNWIHWTIPTRFTERLQSFSPSATSASREGKTTKLKKISCFAVVSLLNVFRFLYVSTALKCAFRILVHLRAPTQAAWIRAPSSRNVTRRYPPEERTTTSRMRYTAKRKIDRKVGMEILLCTERLEKID